VYHNPEVRKVLANGVRWAMPTIERTFLPTDHHPVGWFE
jgi:trehalose utilization protein